MIDWSGLLPDGAGEIVSKPIGLSNSCFFCVSAFSSLVELPNPKPKENRGNFFSGFSIAFSSFD